MKVRRFNPADDLIIVKARLYGPRGDRPLLLAFDIAATETHIVPEIVDDLGYSPRQGEAITSVRSAIGKERGYTLRVTRFASFGFSFPDFVVHVHDLPRGSASMACWASAFSVTSTTRCGRTKVGFASTESLIDCLAARIELRYALRGRSSSSVQPRAG